MQMPSLATAAKHTSCKRDQGGSLSSHSFSNAARVFGNDRIYVLHLHQLLHTHAYVVGLCNLHTSVTLRVACNYRL